MTKTAFKHAMTNCRDRLTVIRNNYDYLTQEEQNEIINAIGVICRIGNIHSIKEYERTKKLSDDLKPLFDEKLSKKSAICYEHFKQWEIDNYHDYVNHSHVSAEECEIKPPKVHEIKEHYKAYLDWFIHNKED